MLIAFFANYWLIIAAVIIFILLMLFRNYFLRTSRNIQRLEALGEIPSCLFQCLLILNCAQLVVHCIHIYQWPYLVCPPLEHSRKREHFLIIFIFIRMNILSVGTLKSPPFVGLAWEWIQLVHYSWLLWYFHQLLWQKVNAALSQIL